jgi:hypothetical protein
MKNLCFDRALHPRLVDDGFGEIVGELLPKTTRIVKKLSDIAYLQVHCNQYTRL